MSGIEENVTKNFEMIKISQEMKKCDRKLEEFFASEEDKR